MVQSLASRPSRGDSWVRSWLWIGLLALAASPAGAQDAATKAAAKKDAPPATKGEPKADPKGAAPAAGAEDDTVGVVDTSPTKKRETTELFKDPRVAKALPNTFPELRYPNPRVIDRDVDLVRAMAAGQATPDRAAIVRLVDSMAADLTNRTHIKALIEYDPKGSPLTARGIERASSTLLDLIAVAKANNNQAFLAVYTPLLNEKLTPLLENHLYARVEAAIALASVAAPGKLDQFTKLIADPNQIVWVKLWAARGLSNATNGGKVLVDVVQGRAAAAALVGFLSKEPTAPWPVKVRIFEAIGSIRVLSTVAPTGPPDVPATCLKFVADPAFKIEARSWAAWALGMIPIPTAVAKYNFGVEIYQIGRLAADLGDRIGDEYDDHADNFAKESDPARALTGLLLYQVYPALAGEEGVRESGLLNFRHPSMTAVQPFAKGLDEQIRNVARAAVDLLNAGGTQAKEAREVLGTRVAELNAFLAKNVPAEVDLYPGGPKFPAAPAQVAGGPAPGK